MRSALVVLIALAMWLLLDGMPLGRGASGYPLAFLGAVLIAAFAASAVSGSLETWYRDLAFPSCRPSPPINSCSQRPLRCFSLQPRTGLCG